MPNARIISLSVLPVVQPIGEFFVGVIAHNDLLEIAFADIREMERDLDRYLGIQRKLSKDRVAELNEYVNTKDATFPTSIILAVPDECVEWDNKRSTMNLRATADVDINHIAKILDGQHRIEGLREYKGDTPFQINVTIFVEADIADQANIFATVNLAQTKVNKSLVYDLFDYAKSRSPQKTAHEVTVALDRAKGGPLQERIKRLGTRTQGRFGETLTQATVVNTLLELISESPMTDRDLLMRGKRLKPASESELAKRPFRNLFIEGKDLDIAQILNNYFAAIQRRWPEAWEDRAAGNILARTNGFRAFMRLFRPLYVDMCKATFIGDVLRMNAFAKRLEAVNLADDDFNTQNYVPGTSGETKLFNDLARFTKVDLVSTFFDL